MSHLRSFFCPACGAKLQVRSSHQNTRDHRDQYASCSNAICGATYLLHSEIRKLISPPSRYFRDNLPNYDLFEANEYLFDCAVDFVQREFLHTETRNVLLSNCIAYLQMLSDKTEEDLTILAARAIAVVDSRCCDDWQVQISDCSAQAVVVRDSYGLKHVLSLRELVQAINNREAKHHTATKGGSYVF